MWFEWEQGKDLRNQEVYGVAFSDAAAALADRRRMQIEDPDGCGDAQRFAAIGLCHPLRQVLVSQCRRGSGRQVHIIASRPATESEDRQYRRRLAALASPTTA